MKYKPYKLTNLIILLLIILFLFGGCANYNKATLASINGRKLTLEDFRYELYLVEAEKAALDEKYSSLLGNEYWDYEWNGTDMRQAAKNTVLTRVIMYEIISDQAAKSGTFLTEQERVADENAAEAFLNSLDQDTIEAFWLDRMLLIRIFHRNSLVDKYIDEIYGTFDIDEEMLKKSIIVEDYREYKTECLYIPTVTMEDRKLAALSETEAEVNYAIISSALEKVKSGSDFQSILAEEQRLTRYERSFVRTDDIPEKAYREASLLLEDDQYSGIITTEFGYYIIHLLDSNSMERYQQAVQKAVDTEKKKQFEAYYNTIKEQYEININFEEWDKVKMGQ